MLVTREVHPQDTLVDIGAAVVGGDHFVVIAGPCAVESEEQMCETARGVKAAGAAALRGGAFKQRTSPYSFQGLGARGLEIMQRAGREVDLPIVTEVVAAGDVELVAARADALQVGARNMQNSRLLGALGGCGKPVVLKRGMAATIDELLQAAEHILTAGNAEVVLCERGIRTFEPRMRNTLDLSAVAFLKRHSHLPVLVDPSHGSGRRELVAPMARAAAACGADGIMVEVHHRPDAAQSDGEQSLSIEQLQALMTELKPFVTAAGKLL